MVFRVRRRKVLFAAAAGAAAPVLAAAWITPAQAAPAEEGSAPIAAGADEAAQFGTGAIGIFAVQHGKVWRLPVQAGDTVDHSRGGIAVVNGGTRDRLQVQLRLTKKDVVLPSRGFAPDWTFTPGDLVLVRPVPASRAHPAEAVVEPLTRVVAGEARTEVWAPNMTGGPRLAAVIAAR
jgi:hypothetical protein